LKQFSVVIIAVVLLFSCRKEQDLSTIDLGYSYFPNKVGSYIIYEVDSTYYGITDTTFHYQIKEELTEQFTDETNQSAMRIHRFHRVSNGHPWVLIDVWTQKRTTNTAEKVVENIRYINLEFPIKEGNAWNGNAMNNFPVQEYKSVQVNQYYDVGILQFEKTLKVQQKNNVNLVDNQNFFEIYASGVGLVYRQATDLNTQGSQTSGYDVQYRAISYSIE